MNQAQNIKYREGEVRQKVEKKAAKEVRDRAITDAIRRHGPRKKDGEEFRELMKELEKTLKQFEQELLPRTS
jgi:hypothetical protein